MDLAQDVGVGKRAATAPHVLHHRHAQPFEFGTRGAVDEHDLPGGQRVSLFRGFSYRRESMGHIPEESERKTMGSREVSEASGSVSDKADSRKSRLFGDRSRRTTGADKSENRI